MFRKPRGRERTSLLNHFKCSSVSDWNVCEDRPGGRKYRGKGELLVNHLYNQIRLFRSHVGLFEAFRLSFVSPPPVFWRLLPW